MYPFNASKNITSIKNKTLRCNLYDRKPANNVRFVVTFVRKN